MTPLYLLVDTRTQLVLAVTTEAQIAHWLARKSDSLSAEVAQKDTYSLLMVRNNRGFYPSIIWSPRTYEIGIASESQVSRADHTRGNALRAQVIALSYVLGNHALRPRDLQDETDSWGFSEGDERAILEISGYPLSAALLKRFDSRVSR